MPGRGPEGGRELTGQVAIVTGGAQGIGRAIAEHLALAGAAVAVADVQGAGQAASRIEQLGGRALAVEVDVTSEAATVAMADSVQDALGNVDILVNNAGLFTTLDPGPFESITVQRWRKVMDVNVMGPFLCARACLGAMRRQGGGRIINIASATPFKGTPYTLDYVTSKGAVVALTRALARELGPLSVLVNAVAPGLTLSDGLLGRSAVFEAKIESSASGRALERQQYPADVVGAVRFLAGPGAAFITGQTLVVDGGSYLH